MFLNSSSLGSIIYSVVPFFKCLASLTTQSTIWSICLSIFSIEYSINNLIIKYLKNIKTKFQLIIKGMQCSCFVSRIYLGSSEFCQVFVLDLA